jgi:hypothetical protein
LGGNASIDHATLIGMRIASNRKPRTIALISPFAGSTAVIGTLDLLTHFQRADRIDSATHYIDYWTDNSYPVLSWGEGGSGSLPVSRFVLGTVKFDGVENGFIAQDAETSLSGYHIDGDSGVLTINP